MDYDKIYIVGSIALDDIETPDTSGSRLLGGSATYGSIFASAFTPVSIIGIVGDDFPQQGYDVFKKYDINTNNLEIAKGSTFSWGGKYHQDFNFRDTLFTNLGVFETYHPTIEFNNQENAILFLANIHPLLQQHAINQCPSEYFIAADTMNLWIDNNKKELINVLKHVNLLFINEEEATSLTGTNTVDDAANKLLEIGPDSIVIKRGSYGATYISKDTTCSVGICEGLSVVDPTGAGDAFAGGFLGSLIKNGPDIDIAIRYGTATAGLAISSLGAQNLDISINDIEQLKNTIK